MRELRKRIIAIFLGICLAIILMEFLLFVLDIPHFYQAHSDAQRFLFFRVSDRDFIYVNSPAKSIRFVYDSNPRGYFGKNNEVDHITNSAGFRGGGFSAEKSASTFRIAFLGDSFTFGEGVHFADTYPELTSQFLKQKYTSLPVDFESYNFAVGGYNTSQALFLLKHIVFRTKPDLVVLGYALNDAEQELFEVNQDSGAILRRPREVEIPEGLSDSPAPKSWLYKSRILRLCWQLSQNKKRTQKTIAYYRALFSESNPGWRRSRSSLQEIIRFCRERDTPCYVLLFPILYQLNNKYPFKDIHLLIRQQAESAGAIFLDLLSPLNGLKAQTLWVHPTDQHPNEKVHALAARTIFEAISFDNHLDTKIRSLSLKR